MRRHPVPLDAPIESAPELLPDGSALVVAGSALVRVDPGGHVVSRRPGVDRFARTASGLVIVTDGGEVRRIAEDGEEASLGALPSAPSAPPVDAGDGLVAIGTDAGELWFFGGPAPRRVPIAHAALHRPVLDAPRRRVFVAAGSGALAAVSVVPLVE